MKNIKKIKTNASKKTADTKTQEALARKGKKAVSGCPELMLGY